MRTIICEVCKKTVTATSCRQKYCPECSVKVAKERAQFRYGEKNRRKRTEKTEWTELQAYDSPENIAICLTCRLPMCRETSMGCRRTQRIRARLADRA